jgi:hypothetical protein
VAAYGVRLAVAWNAAADPTYSAVMAVAVRRVSAWNAWMVAAGHAANDRTKNAVVVNAMIFKCFIAVPAHWETIYVQKAKRAAGTIAARRDGAASRVRTPA